MGAEIEEEGHSQGRGLPLKAGEGKGMGFLLGLPKITALIALFTL